MLKLHHAPPLPRALMSTTSRRPLHLRTRGLPGCRLARRSTARWFDPHPWQQIPIVRFRSAIEPTPWESVFWPLDPILAILISERGLHVVNNFGFCSASSSTPTSSTSSGYQSIRTDNSLTRSQCSRILSRGGRRRTSENSSFRIVSNKSQLQKVQSSRQNVQRAWRRHRIESGVGNTERSCESHWKNYFAKVKSLISIYQLEFASIYSPDTASFVQKMEREKRAKQHGADADNRSFLAKYVSFPGIFSYFIDFFLFQWMYIVPVVIFAMISSAVNPEAGGEGQAAQ